MSENLSKADIERIIDDHVDPDIPFQESVVGVDNAAEQILNEMYSDNKEDKMYYKYLTEDMVDMLHASKKSTIIGLINDMIGEAQSCPANNQSRCTWLDRTRMENIIWGNMSQGEVDGLDSHWGDEDEI